MNNKTTIDEKTIIWSEVSVEWMQALIVGYNKANKDLGVEYLSMGALRYGKKYFVGYYFDSNNIDSPFELVSYIQYQKREKKLSLNYIEVNEKYRGNGLSSIMIEKFYDSLLEDSKNKDIEVSITPISYDGKRANLKGKLENKFGKCTERKSFL